MADEVSEGTAALGRFFSRVLAETQTLTQELIEEGVEADTAFWMASKIYNMGVSAWMDFEKEKRAIADQVLEKAAAQLESENVSF